MVSLRHIDVQSPYGGGSHTTMPNKKNLNASAGLSAAQLIKYAEMLGEFKRKLPEIRKRFNKPLFGGPTYEQMLEDVKAHSGQRKGNNSQKSKSSPDFSKKQPNFKTQRYAAPTMIGSTIGQSFIRFRGNPQVLTDQTGSKYSGGVRIEFSDVLGSSVSTAAGQPIKGGNIYPALSDNPAVDSICYHEITPSALSLRVAKVETMYEFYAIRSLTFEYVPYDGTDQRGSVLMGFYREPMNFEPENISMQYIMEMEGSNCCSVWSPGAVTYKFNGTKTWSCRLGNADAFTGAMLANGYMQGLFLLGLSGTLTETVQHHGWIRVSGVVDFYRDTTTYNTTLLGLRGELGQLLKKRWLHTAPVHRLPFNHWAKTREARGLIDQFRNQSAKSLDTILEVVEQKEK